MSIVTRLILQWIICSSSGPQLHNNSLIHPGDICLQTSTSPPQEPHRTSDHPSSYLCEDLQLTAERLGQEGRRGRAASSCCRGGTLARRFGSAEASACLPAFSAASAPTGRSSNIMTGHFKLARQGLILQKGELGGSVVEGWSEGGEVDEGGAWQRWRRAERCCVRRPSARCVLMVLMCTSRGNLSPCQP